MEQMPILVVVTGPTASGKTELAIRLAEHYSTEIVSADSRQIFKDLPIGTAAPSAGERSRAFHHLWERMNSTLITVPRSSRATLCRF